MQLPFSDLITNILGIQSILPSQFGAQQAQPGFESLDDFDHNDVDNKDVTSCEFFTQALPRTFTVGSSPVRYIRDNFAVMPGHWTRNGGVATNWLNIETPHKTTPTCLQDLKSAPFLAFDEGFFNFLGSSPEFSVLYEFPEEEQGRVHEAPVYIAETNELVFADTSVVGWLYGLEVETGEIRKITTSPPLHNVNGGTRHKNNIYLTTNGSPTPAIYNCTVPKNKPVQPGSGTEKITCHPIINNYRTAHLNAPNDLIFTPPSSISGGSGVSHLLFTDPNYGWDQEWPGVLPPSLPTTLYHFNVTSRALLALTNSDVLAPNGLALSPDSRTLYIADSNSTSSRPVTTWDSSIRNVYAFDIDLSVPRVSNRRLVHVVEAGWPDGLRVTNGGLLLVASMGGIDVVDVSRGGVLLGKWNVGDDVLFNLEPVGKEKKVWLLTGKKGVYKVRVAG